MSNVSNIYEAIDEAQMQLSREMEDMGREPSGFELIDIELTGEEAEFLLDLLGNYQRQQEKEEYDIQIDIYTFRDKGERGWFWTTEEEDEWEHCDGMQDLVLDYVRSLKTVLREIELVNDGTKAAQVNIRNIIRRFVLPEETK